MKLIILSHPHQDVWLYHKVVPRKVEPCSSSIVKPYRGFVPSVQIATFRSYYDCNAYIPSFSRNVLFIGVSCANIIKSLQENKCFHINQRKKHKKDEEFGPVLSKLQ